MHSENQPLLAHNTYAEKGTGQGQVELNICVCVLVEHLVRFHPGQANIISDDLNEGAIIQDESGSPDVVQREDLGEALLQFD